MVLQACGGRAGGRIEQVTVLREYVGAVVIVSAQLLLAASGRADDQRPGPSPSPSPSPSPPPAGTIASSVDRVVQEVEDARLAPCRPSVDAGLPCFSAAVEAKADYSVAEYLRQLQPEGSGHSGGPGGIAIDPVCSVKHLLKKLAKKNDTYYLYRVWDRTGEHAVMKEQPFSPDVFQGIPEFHFEYLGRVAGECAAVAAFSRADRHAPGDPAAPERGVAAAEAGSGPRP
jgi:hypothetical protein